MGRWVGPVSEGSEGGWGLRALAPVAALFAIIVIAWFPGIFPGGVISVADELFTFPPWEAQRPAGYPGPANKLLLDQVVQVYPWADYARARLGAFELPLWNPYTACGTTFIGNQNAGLFSPLHLPLWFAPSTAHGLTLVALAKVLLALLGAWFLARRLGCSAAAARLAAVTWAMGAQSLVWLGHPLTTASVFLPWSLALVEVELARPSRTSRRAAACLGLVTAAHLLGSHPETSLHIAAGTVGYAVLRLEGWRQGGWRRLLPVCLGLCLGILTASIQLLPFVEALRDSYPAAMRREQAMRWHIPATALPLAWAPHLYGTPMDLNHREDLLGDSNYAETAIFAGVLPLLLVPAVLPALLRQRRLRALALIGVAGLLVAFDPGGVAGSLLHAIPLIGLGAHHRLSMFWTLALACLFAAAVDALTTGARVSRWCLGGALLVAVAALTAGVARLAPAGAWSTKAVVLASWAVGLVAIGTVLVTRRAQLSPRSFTLLVLVLSLFDLWLFGRAFNPVVDPESIFPETPATRFLAAQPGPFRVLGLTRVAPPNTAMVYGLEDIRGYEPLFRDDYQRFWWEVMTGRGVWQQFHWDEMQAPQVLRLLGVRYLVDGPRSPPLTERGLAVELVHEGDARIFRITGDLPRAVSRHEVDLEASPAAAGRRLRAGYPFEQRVILDRPPDVAPGPARAGADRLDYRRPSPERAVIDAEMATAGIVVLAETFDPGFRATIDGQPARLMRAYGIFQAVAVTAGRHEIVFEYRPRSLSLGMGLSAAGLLGLLAMSLSGRQRETA